MPLACVGAGAGSFKLYSHLKLSKSLWFLVKTILLCFVKLSALPAHLHITPCAFACKSVCVRSGKYWTSVLEASGGGVVLGHMYLSVCPSVSLYSC